MKTLDELFYVKHGNKLDLNKMTRRPAADGGINFVGRSSERHGISASIASLPEVEPFARGLITVALGGAKLLSAFVQDDPFYTAQNVVVLKPRSEMSFAEKVFVCMCIRHNRWRYSAFGREANRTIRTIQIPPFPAWVVDSRAVLEDVVRPLSKAANVPPASAWKPFTLGKLFAIKKGRRLIRRERRPGPTPFVGTSTRHNGIVGYIDTSPMFPASSITIPYNGQGGVGWACYQPDAFCASDDVQVLLPPPGVDIGALLFVSVVLRRLRYLFSFARKWHLERMNETTIHLPSASNGQPDWKAMSAFMRGLPFAAGALADAA